jgi:hypothetical protein
MNDRPRPLQSTEEMITLLGVRLDGVATVVDLMPADNAHNIHCRAQWLLREHASCHTIEVWRGGALVEQLGRL